MPTGRGSLSPGLGKGRRSRQAPPDLFAVRQYSEMLEFQIKSQKPGI